MTICSLYYNWISICLGATTDNLDPGVLYQVKASYKYQAEDVDELNFEVGEVIDVVEYDDPEEQVLRYTWKKSSIILMKFNGRIMIFIN